MLSNETAVGKYPLNTLAFLDKLIRFYQNNVKLKFQWEELKWKNYNDNLSYVLYSAKKIVSKL
jgi:pyruvate kinase